MTTIEELDTFTKLFLLIIFIVLFIRVCYVYFSTYRRRSNQQHVHDKITTTGLPIDVINSYHTFPYAKDNIATNSSDHETTCSICISDYEESEMLRMMPHCRHYFHRDCVDMWLKVNGSCPICRDSLLQATNGGSSSTLECV